MGAIRDAYALTDPWLYYPLDDGSLTDIGSNSHGATLSGDTDLTALGPERGFTALHMGTTGVITSDTLGMNTLTDFSFSCYFMMAPLAAWNAYRPLLTIGVRGTVAGSSWGGGLGLNGVNGGSPQPYGAAWPGIEPSGGVPGASNPNFWHHFAMTYVSSTKTVQTYTDGVAGTTGTIAATPAAFKVSDRLVVAWTFSQCVIAHIAFWRFQVTPTMMGSIGGFAANWPPNQQISVGGSGGGGGTGGTVTIGEPQASQITNIETHTNDIPGIVDAVNFISDTVNHIKGVTDQIGTDVTNIVNTLFPQLANAINDLGAQLNDVQNAVRGTIKQGSDTLTKTVGELMSRGNATDLSYDSLSGGETCSPINVDVSGNHLYGIRLEITAYPPEWKFRTPDLAWSLKDLAVIRVYRSGKLEARQGVHTIVHTWEPIPQPGYPFLGIFPPVQTDGTVITVDFAEGVCGNLIGIEFPGP